MWDRILANTVEYTPGSFNLGDFKSLVKSFTIDEPRPYMIYGSANSLGYMSAVMANDKEKIAFFERKWKIEKITKFRSLILRWGTEAKVVAWLNEKNTKISDNKKWQLNLWGLTYRGFGKGEFESVNLFIDRNIYGLYAIRLRASEDYGEEKHNVILRQGITYKSLFNRINYFVKKLKAGVY